MGQPPFAFRLADSDLRVRGGAVPTPHGGVAIRLRGADGGPYRTLIEIPGGDFHPLNTISFTRDGTGLITATSVGTPATRLTRIDAATGDITTLSSDPHHDMAETWWTRKPWSRWWPSTPPARGRVRRRCLPVRDLRLRPGRPGHPPSPPSRRTGGP